MNKENYKEIAGIIKSEIDKELIGHKVLIKNNEEIIREGIQKNALFNDISYQNNIYYSKSYMDGLEEARSIIANKLADYFKREDRKQFEETEGTTMFKGEYQFSIEQFRKWCGVEK